MTIKYDNDETVEIGRYIIVIEALGVGWQASVFDRFEYCAAATPENSFVGTTNAKARVIIDACEYVQFLQGEDKR